MLRNLGNIGFIGDLSAQDADILAMYATKHAHVMEFGVGGSTQIIAQCMPKTLISIDTDTGWIARTKENLALLEFKSDVTFGHYSETPVLVTDKTFGMVLVDGVDHLREDFAKFAWRFIDINGVMLFHDTRRPADFSNVAEVAKHFFNEISLIEVNARASNGKSSNITVLHKKVHEPYENWNVVEGKPAWAFGGEPNVDNNPFWKQPGV